MDIFFIPVKSLSWHLAKHKILIRHENIFNYYACPNPKATWTWPVKRGVACNTHTICAERGEIRLPSHILQSDAVWPTKIHALWYLGMLICCVHMLK